MSGVSHMILQEMFSAPVTSYANSGGTGARSGVITITGTATFGAGSSANLINGTQDDVAFLNSGQTTATLIFDFGVGSLKYIDEVKWYQSGATANGTFTAGFSLNGTSIINSSSSVAFGSSATVTQGIIWPYPQYFRFFHLTQTSGTTSSGPFVREVEFKISA